MRKNKNVQDRRKTGKIGREPPTEKIRIDNWQVTEYYKLDCVQALVWQIIGSCQWQRVQQQHKMLCILRTYTVIPYSVLYKILINSIQNKACPDRIRTVSALCPFGIRMASAWRQHGARMVSGGMKGTERHPDQPTERIVGSTAFLGSCSSSFFLFEPQHRGSQIWDLEVSGLQRTEDLFPIKVLMRH